MLFGKALADVVDLNCFLLDSRSGQGCLSSGRSIDCITRTTHSLRNQAEPGVQAVAGQSQGGTAWIASVDISDGTCSDACGLNQRTKSPRTQEHS